MARVSLRRKTTMVLLLLLILPLVACLVLLAVWSDASLSDTGETFLMTQTLDGVIRSKITDLSRVTGSSIAGDQNEAPPTVAAVVYVGSAQTPGWWKATVAWTWQDRVASELLHRMDNASDPLASMIALDAATAETLRAALHRSTEACPLSVQVRVAEPLAAGSSSVVVATVLDAASACQVPPPPSLAVQVVALDSPSFRILRVFNDYSSWLVGFHSDSEIACAEGDLQPEHVEIALNRGIAEHSSHGLRVKYVKKSTSSALSSNVYLVSTEPVSPRLQENDILSFRLKGDVCRQSAPPFMFVPAAAYRATVKGSFLWDPWWLCANLHHQKNVLDAVESVTHAPPFTAPFGIPLKMDHPDGGTSRHYALAILDYLQKQDPTKVWAIDILHSYDDPFQLRSHVLADALGADGNGADNEASRRWVHLTANDTHVVDICDEGVSNATVFFVTPVEGRKAQLTRMLEQHRQHALAGERNFGLCLVAYDESNNYDLDAMVREHIPDGVPVRTIHRQGPFMKAEGLQQCIDDLGDSDIAFVLDVDMDFDRTLVAQTRRFVQQGQRVFCPIVHYDMLDEDGSIYPDSPSGYATMGTGLIGAFVSDIRAMGGFNTRDFGEGHGWEDTDFFFRLRHLGLEVVRFRSNRLVHMPHERTGPWAAKSTATRAPEAFGCEPVSSYLDHHSFDPLDMPDDSLLGSRVYYSNAGEDFYDDDHNNIVGMEKAVRSGFVVEVRRTNFASETKLLVQDDADGGRLWISCSSSAGTQVVPMKSKGCVISLLNGLVAEPLFWPEYAHSHFSPHRYFLSRRSVVVDSNSVFRLDFASPGAEAVGVLVSTGSGQLAEGLLVNGALSARCYANRDPDLDDEIDEEAEEQPECRAVFVAGVAFCRFAYRCRIERIDVVVRSPQNSLLIQDVELLQS